MSSTKSTKGHQGHRVLAEGRLEEIAASFDYPPTPDVSSRVRQRLARPRPAMADGRRRLAWAAVIALLLLASLLAVPQVRAALGEILRIGAMTVFVEEEGAPPEAPAAGPAVTATARATPPAPSATAPATAAAGPSPAQTLAVVPATPVSLAAAREMVDTPLRLPAHPDDLGAPDSVYVDRRERPGVVIFVWDRAGRTDEPRLSLYQIQQANFGSKLVEQVAETTVNGRRALWLEGPHLFQLANGSLQPWHFVPGPVLLWTEGQITYRLEGAPSLEEAVRIAESLVATSER